MAHALLLVVHDFGGPVALPLAAMPERIVRLVVINSWCWHLGHDGALALCARAERARGACRRRALPPQEEAPGEVNRRLDGFLPCASGEPAMLRRA